MICVKRPSRAVDEKLVATLALLEAVDIGWVTGETLSDNYKKLDTQLSCQHRHSEREGKRWAEEPRRGKRNGGQWSEC